MIEDVNTTGGESGLLAESSVMKRWLSMLHIGSTTLEEDPARILSEVLMEQSIGSDMIIDSQQSKTMAIRADHITIDDVLDGK